MPNGKEAPMLTRTLSLFTTVLVLPQVFGAACGSSNDEGPTDGSALADAGHSLDACGRDGKASVCGGHPERDAASGSDSAPGHDAQVPPTGGGPASDPFPRTYLNAIGGDKALYVSGNTLAGVPFATVAAQSNIVEINPYLGFEQSYGLTVASLMHGWKAAATANGVTLRTLMYNDGWANQYGAPGGTLLHPWLENAFNSSSMWAYTASTASGNGDDGKYLTGTPGRETAAKLISISAVLTPRKPLRRSRTTERQMFWRDTASGTCTRSTSTTYGLGGSPCRSTVKTSLTLPIPMSTASLSTICTPASICPARSRRPGWDLGRHR
jgi:hypothetical protein